jgi:Flp pilus assembly protein TadD
MLKERLPPWGLVVVAAASVLAIGGVHPTTQVLLSVATFGLVAVFALRVQRQRGLRSIPLLWPAVLATGFTCLQLLPLPGAILVGLSPTAHELRSETGASWMPITLDAPATWLAALRGFTCLGLLLLAGGGLRQPRRARRVLYGLVAIGSLLAMITLLQRLVGAQSILGLYTPRSMPGTGFFGTFVSGNHAASMLALSSLIAAGLAAEAREGRRFLFLCCAILCGAMVFFTASRAGAAGLAVGGAVLATVLLVRRLGAATGVLTSLALVALSLGVTLWLADGLRSRLLPSQGETVVASQKVRGWKDAAATALAYRWTGVGRGAFEAPAAAFRSDDEAVRLVYPENFVLQTSTEWGVPFALLMLGWAGVLLLGLVRGLRKCELGVIGAATGVLAVLTHDLADFGLEIPGVLFPTVIALGVVIARSEERLKREQEGQPRIPFRLSAAGIAAWAIVILGASWAVPHTLDADFAVVSAAFHSHDPRLSTLLEHAIARHPADDHFELLAAENTLLGKDPSALRHLNRALRLHPANWQAHYLAARTLLGMHRRGQAALEYRSAIERGMLPPLGEMITLLGSKIVDGYPQRPDDLVRLGHALAAQHHAADADEACQRAVGLATTPAFYLLQRVQVAMEADDAKTLIPAAQALLDSQPDPEMAATAIRALSQAGDVKATEDGLERMIKLHPESSMLVLLGSQLRFDRGDLTGARALLKHSGDGSYSLHDRLRAEELMAKIADKEGDVDGAIVARARARMIGHKLNDTSAMP